MSIEQEIQDLTQSTTDLLNAVNVEKATLDNAVATAEAAVSVATTKATEAASVVSSASTSATEASASAANAATSAASASQLVTGVDSGLPEVRPSLNLDFVNSKVVDSRIDFTRSTTATYYDGKTVAKAEENLFAYSTDLNNGWAKGRMTFIANNAVAPDGTTTAMFIQNETGVTNAAYFRRGAYNGASGLTTYSLYIKAGTGRYVMFRHTVGNVDSTFDLQTGSLGTIDPSVTASIVSVGDGWYRCSVTADIVAGNNFGIWYFTDTDDTVVVDSSYDGSYYIWGPQKENRDSVTAYTPTTDSPITNYVPVLQTAAINEPRLDHDPVTGECKGLLMEESRTNQLVNSVPRDSTWYNSAGFYDNVAIAPDGTQSATLMNPPSLVDPGGATYTSRIYMGVSSTTGQVLTFSVYVKPEYTISLYPSPPDTTEAARDVRLALFADQSQGASFWNCTTKSWESIDPDHTVTQQEVGNGWYRISITYTVGADDTSNNHFINMTNRTGNTAFDPYPSGQEKVYLWGAQIETGSFPTSYIPTSGASVTRASDSAFMDFSSIVPNSNELSYVMSASKQGSLGSWSRYITIRDYADRNRTIGSLNPAGHFYMESYYETANVTSTYREYDTVGGQEITFGASLKNNEMIYDTANSSSYLDSSGNAPKNMSLIYFGNVGSQHTKYFKLFSHSIAQSELEALTQE